MTTTTTIEQGIHDLTREEYDALPFVSQSMLKAAQRSMAHAKAYIDGHRKESPALAFGQAYHVFLLEQERFAEVYRVLPKMRRAGKAWEAAMEEAAAEGKEIVFAEDAETFAAMRAALLASSRKRKLAAAPGRYELSMVWKDQHSGLMCKGRVDKLIESIRTVIDLKKCRDARSHAFGSSAAEYGYDIQAAFYMDGLKAITGEAHDFVFLCQEDEAPYSSAMYRVEVGDETYRAGRTKYRNTIAALSQCMASGVFPDYGDDVEPLVLPKWAVPSTFIEEEVSNG